MIERSKITLQLEMHRCMNLCVLLETYVGVTNVGCRHIYMQRQPLVELFDNIYYNRTVYTDVLE
jgi:hypothetical protein